jgi:hypothetical protein
LPDVLQFGPFILKTDWLIVGLGGIIGYTLMKRVLKRSVYDEGKVLEIYISALMIVALTWKFSPFIFNPSLLWENPQTILFLTGSSLHMWIGIAAALGYIYFQMKKSNIPFFVMLNVLPIGYLVLLIVYNFLKRDYGNPTILPWGISLGDAGYKYHPINVYQVIVLLPAFMWLWKKSSNIDQRIIFSHFLSLYGAGQMMVSFFKPQTEYGLGLSLEQMIYLGLLIVGNLLSYYITSRVGKPRIDRLS